MGFFENYSTRSSRWANSGKDWILVSKDVKSSYRSNRRTGKTKRLEVGEVKSSVSELDSDNRMKRTCR